MAHRKRSLVLAGALGALVLASTPVQAGACRDTWINNAYRDNGLGQPSGNDNRGECNVKLYGNGSWSSYDDLKGKVRAYRNTSYPSGQCRDSYITQAYTQAQGRAPNGKAESGECDMYLYGNGQWSGLEDLKTKVRQYQASIGGAPAAPSLRLDSSGNVVNSAGATIALSAAIAGLITNDGGTLVGQDGGTLVSDNGLGLARLGASAVQPSYGLQSTSKGKKIVGKVTLRDGRVATVIYK